MTAELSEGKGPSPKAPTPELTKRQTVGRLVTAAGLGAVWYGMDHSQTDAGATVLIIGTFLLVAYWGSLVFWEAVLKPQNRLVRQIRAPIPTPEQIQAYWTGMGTEVPFAEAVEYQRHLIQQRDIDQIKLIAGVVLVHDIAHRAQSGRGLFF